MWKISMKREEKVITISTWIKILNNTTQKKILLLQKAAIKKVEKEKEKLLQCPNFFIYSKPLGNQFLFLSNQAQFA